MFGTKEPVHTIIGHEEPSLTRIDVGELLVSTFEDLADHTMVLSEDKTFTPSKAYGVSTEPPFPSSAEEAFSQSLAQEGDEVCTLQVIKPSSQEDSRNTISDGDEATHEGNGSHLDVQEPSV